MKLFLITFSFFTSVTAFSAEVIAVSSGRKSVAISPEPGSPWVAKDRVCVMQNQTDVVCGSVLKTTVKGAIVSLDTLYEGLSIGDQVRKVANNNRRLTAETIETFAQVPRRNFDLTAGLGAGLSFFYPMLHFQVALGKHFSLGVQPLYYKASGGTISISAVGAMLTGNYYGNPYFRGFWICAGLGMNSISVEDATLVLSEKSSSLLGVLTAGWRARWGSGWNAGIAGGIQYLADPNFSSVVLSSSGIQPLLTLDFGFNF